MDLYIIHWPVAGSIEAWKEMEKLYDEGLVKALGVSNFSLNKNERVGSNPDDKFGF